MKTLQKKTENIKKTPEQTPALIKERDVSFSRRGTLYVLLFALMVLSSFSVISGAARAQSITNLIGNSDLEATMLVPAIWNRGGFGENTAHFSYPQTGVGESRAVRVDMAAYESGDAKWYFDDVPVKPSTKYTFSDNSFSNVPTAIDIRYKIKNAANKHAFRYVKLGDVPVQSTATAKSFTFTTPPNAISLTVFHYINRVGYLVTDNYSLVEGDGSSSGGTGTTTPDTVSPIVSITSPLDGATISGMVALSVSASDNVGVAGVRVVHSGTNHSDIPIGTEDMSSPYSFDWDTTHVANGVHMLRAQARDAAGNIATSTTISVTVNNATSTAVDTTAPTVSVTAPIDGATVYGTTTISVTAADNVGVAGVSILLDGTAMSSEDIDAPYSFNWNTASTSNGTHVLTAQARDTAGNIATSSAVSVAVTN